MATLLVFSLSITPPSTRFFTRLLTADSDSFSFLMNDYLFSGDTLLINGTGRTDFQNGSAKDSYNSIFNKTIEEII